MSVNYRLLVTTIIMLILSSGCYAKSDKLAYDYNISGIAIAMDGYYLVEVSVTVGNKKEANIDVVKQYAIMGCLYKGFVVDRISQKPLLSHAVSSKDQAYLQKLILNDYNTYASTSHPLQIVKVGKKYRVTGIILVSKDALRKNLEEAGIIRKLGL